LDDEIGEINLIDHAFAQRLIVGGHEFFPQHVFRSRLLEIRQREGGQHIEGDIGELGFLLLENALEIPFLVGRRDDEARLEIARAHGAGEIHDQVAELVIASRGGGAFLPALAAMTARFLSAGFRGRFLGRSLGRMRRSGCRNLERDLFLHPGEEDKLGDREADGGGKDHGGDRRQPAFKAGVLVARSALVTGAGLVARTCLVAWWRGILVLGFLRIRLGHGRCGTEKSGLAAFQIHDVIKHSVGHGDESGTGLETSLGGDEVGELLGQVDIGGFQCARLDAAKALGAGIVLARERVRKNSAADGTGIGQAGVEIVAHPFQRREIVEILKQHLVGGGGSAIGVKFDQITGRVEAGGLELRSHRKTLADLDVADRAQTCAGETLDAQPALCDQKAFVVDPKLAGAGGELLSTGGVLHNEKSVARNAQIIGIARGVEGSLVEIGCDGGELHARADLDGRLAGDGAVRRGGPAQGVAEAFREAGGGGLVTGGVNVGDVGADDFKAFAKGAKCADAGSECADE